MKLLGKLRGMLHLLLNLLVIYLFKKKGIGSCECFASDHRLNFHCSSKNTASVLVRRLLETKKPPSQESKYCSSSLTERMRKRKAFADKELESIMLERELGRRKFDKFVTHQRAQLLNQEHLPTFEANLFRSGYSGPGFLQPCAFQNLDHHIVSFTVVSCVWKASWDWNTSHGLSSARSRNW